MVSNFCRYSSSFSPLLFVLDTLFVGENRKYSLIMIECQFDNIFLVKQ